MMKSQLREFTLIELLVVAAVVVVLVDNLQEWHIVPDRRGNSKPQGVSAFFGDGHVDFCTGAIFSASSFGLMSRDGTMASVTPGLWRDPAND